MTRRKEERDVADMGEKSSPCTGTAAAPRAILAGSSCESASKGGGHQPFSSKGASARIQSVIGTKGAAAKGVKKKELTFLLKERSGTRTLPGRFRDCRDDVEGDSVQKDPHCPGEKNFATLKKSGKDALLAPKKGGEKGKSAI